MSYRLDWHGDRCEREIREALIQWLHAAAKTVAARAKELLGKPGTASRGKGKRREYGAEVSSPGEPPRKQYGTLRASIADEVDAQRFAARVGSNLPKALHLEKGTSRMKARPFLRRALIESKGNLLRLAELMRSRLR